MSDEKFVLKDMDQVRRLPHDKAADLILQNHGHELEKVVRYLVEQGHSAMATMNHLTPVTQVLYEEYGEMQNIMHTVCEKWLSGFPKRKVVEAVLKSRANVINVFEGTTPEAQA